MKPRRRDALERLAHEDIMRELRDAGRDGEKPGQRDERKHTQAREGKQPAHRPSREQRLRDDGDEGNQNRHRSLGDGAESDRGPRQNGTLFPKRQDRRRRAEGERAVEDRRARVYKNERHRCQREPGQPARIGAPAPAREPHQQRDGREREEIRGEARGRLGGAENLHHHRGGREIDDRLVEIRQAVQMRQQIIVRLRHLARHFGIAPFVRIEQRITAEIEGECERRGEHEQRQPHVCAQRGTRNQEPAAAGEKKTEGRGRAWAASATR